MITSASDSSHFRYAIDESCRFTLHFCCCCCFFSIIFLALEKFKYSPICCDVRSIMYGLRHQIAIISMLPSQPTLPPPFSKSHHCQYPFRSVAMIFFPFFVTNDARALRCSSTHTEWEKKYIRAVSHKKSIFRTTLDYVIRSDYASIDVACKHRIIREMM